MLGTGRYAWRQWEKPGNKSAGNLEMLPAIRRRRPDSNRRMRVLQTLALPLGYVALKAGDGIRTHDLLLGKETFYQLNYTRSLVPRPRIELGTP